LFFGRDRDIDELLTRLRRAPALAVIGNSVSGKSSLIQAGLIPALRRGRFRSGQLAPELSAADRAKFIDYCKGGDSLRTAIAALISPSEGAHVPTKNNRIKNPQDQ